MSMMDKVAALRALSASSDIRMMAIQATIESIQNVANEAKALLGEDFGYSQGIGATASAAVRHLDTALAALHDFESAVVDAANAVEQAGG